MAIHLITCAIMEHECEGLRRQGLSLTYLPQGLHQTPSQLHLQVQRAIGQARGRALDRIVLGYGFCGKGLVGVRAEEHPLVIPLISDCLALLIGSGERYRVIRAQEPGTYFLTRGWVEHGGTPLDKGAAYQAALDPEAAGWALATEFRNYQRLVWIETGVDPDGRFKARARESAQFLGLDYEEVPGDLGLLDSTLQGRDDDRCRMVPPGTRVGADLYFDL